VTTSGDPAAAQVLTNAAPLADELMRLVPPITLHDAHFRTFHFKADFGTGRQKWDLYYQEPDHVSLLVTDNKDDTPLMLIVNDSGLLYDVAGGKVLIGQSHGYSVGIDETPEHKFWIHAGFSSENVNRLELNVPVMFKTIVADSVCSVAPEGSDRFLLTGISSTGKARVVAHFDRSRNCALTSVQISKLGSDAKPFVMEFSANEAAPDWVWQFPAAQWVRQKLPAADLFRWNMTSPGALLPLAGGLIRVAFDTPAMRTQMEEQFGRIDWNRAIDSDARISPVLRQIISEARTPKDPSRVAALVSAR
jgi:hypothetical protein